MTDLVKDLDGLLAGWERRERQIPDYPQLTETSWHLDGDAVRHVQGGTRVCLLSAAIAGITHYLPTVDPIPVLTTLLGGEP